MALVPLSWLYGLGWRAYALIYDLGFKRAFRADVKVVCVGNLTVGGTGKSPVTLHIAHVLAILGYEVVVGCSGYGSPMAKWAQVAPEGPLDAAVWGDEPAMIRWLAPDLDLIVGRNRVEAARLAAEKYPGRVLLMDDGLQHLPLAKDLRILLDDPVPANPFCLPAGPYREPRSSRLKVDRVVAPSDILAENEGFWTPNGWVEQPGACAVVCALARPQKFAQSLRERGIRIEVERLLPDHDPMQGGTLFDGIPADLAIMVTAKDWVKLRLRPDLDGRRILVARQRVSIAPEAEFVGWLEERMRQI
ncbi:MAG: tetraacyldisaccharide 4'-kinase [Fimbriimonas sp.]